jgi:hypothetical protein
MSLYNCQYCNNEYSNKSILEMHKKTAKFCLKIQKTIENRTNNIETLKSDFACEHCKYRTTLKSSLIAHIEICKIRLHKVKEENENNINTELKKKDELINKLQNDINILMTQTYPEKERVLDEINAKLQEELNHYKIELRIKDEQLKIKEEQYEKDILFFSKSLLKMKDEINKELKKEFETLKNTMSLS